MTAISSRSPQQQYYYTASLYPIATKKGTIVLNIHLLKAPEQIIDYIILHELCHLIIEGHSHRFWSLLHKYVPDNQDKIDWLNTNSEQLI